MNTTFNEAVGMQVVADIQSGLTLAESLWSNNLGQEELWKWLGEGHPTEAKTYVKKFLLRAAGEYRECIGYVAPRLPRVCP